MMDAPAPPLPEATASTDAHSTDAQGTVRGLIAALLQALHTRLELAGIEVEIHLRALVRSLIWAVGAMACAMLAFAFGLVTLIAALWNTHRMLALLGGTMIFVVLAAVFGYLGARSLRVHPDVLEGSLDQLAQDQRRARGDS
jgi:uncharacterized membrane protein YqjE